jgi:rubrerythrin
MDKHLSEVIDLAIQREEEAYDFYMDIFNKLEDPGIKDTIHFIAGEEKKHKAFLVNYREGDYAPDALRMTDVVDYKISKYLEEPEITKETKREDIYLIASHRELRSHRFYTELANMHDETYLKDMLVKMANEELKHKEKMEYLYANTAFPQTAGG